LDWVFDRGLERALVERDFFALVEAGLRVRLALPFERVRELDRFAEPLLVELEDPADEPLGLVAFLRVLLAVCAITVSLRGLLSSGSVVCGADRCPVCGPARL
jgi:hypothetical protein